MCPLYKRDTLFVLASVKAICPQADVVFLCEVQGCNLVVLCVLFTAVTMIRCHLSVAGMLD